MQRLWTSFAASGSPDRLWPRFTPADEQTLSLRPSELAAGTGYAAEHHCAFWSA